MSAKPGVHGPDIAIALEFEPGADAAPRVTAKGHGSVADQILNLAFANDVPVRRDGDLVQILDAVDVDSVIPPAAFAAVAEILTYVYRANGKQREMGITP